jgi:hypothetical protein
MDDLRPEVARHPLRRVVALTAIAAAASAGACRDVQGRTPAVADTSYRLRPGYVIDSARPVAMELERFRAGLGPAPTELSGGAPSLDSLLSRFARAVQAVDTAALDRMQITPAEFAWLVYPSSPYTRPPFAESPRLVWYQLRSSGASGMARLLQRRGGRPLRIVGRRCDSPPLVEGENRLWRRCQLSIVGVTGRDTVRERLFGVVIERHGRFKFASYQNQY